MGDVPDDNPFSAVLAGQADFVDKLTELEATLDEMMATRDASEGNGIILDEAIRFFDDELLPFLAAEDETILPRLEAVIGRYGTLVNVVGYEHAEIRRGIEKFKDARRALGRQPSWSAIQEANRRASTPPHDNGWRCPISRRSGNASLTESRSPCGSSQRCRRVPRVLRSARSPVPSAIQIRLRATSG